MQKANLHVKFPGMGGHPFDVVFGFDMETDIGSFTPFYEGVKQGTPRLLDLLAKHDIRATFFWAGHAAENNPEMVCRVRDAGHETGCHGLYHETLGDPLFPLPNNWPILPSEVEGRLREATRIVKNCGPKAVKQLDRVIAMFKQRGGRFVTARELAAEYA